MDNKDARMEQFVRDVLMNFLEMRNAPEEWVAPWIARAIELNDPIRIYNEMSDLQANVERLSRMVDAKTAWPNGHFYSPVVSLKEARAEWPRLSRCKSPNGVDLRIDMQLELFRKLVETFPDIPFAREKNNINRYYYNNPSYGFGDALVYWGMLNLFRPKRIIEVGSGFSSALALDIIDILDLPTSATFIDPYPEVAYAATAPLRESHNIIPAKVQDIDVSIIEGLSKNDILFIDSSHVVKTGSDVHFIITELLHRLQPGVIVHFHDISFPFEYGAPWTLIANHSWNETYFLHAFLMYNTRFDIIFFNDLMGRQIPSDIFDVAPVQCAEFQNNRAPDFGSKAVEEFFFQTVT